ncbi:MAG: zinc ribbon domain-containing protein [bacterium]
MPYYDYNCKNCNEEFTVEKSMNDSTMPFCPKCKSSDVGKIWGNFSLKGCDCKNTGSASLKKGCGSCRGNSCSGC